MPNDRCAQHNRLRPPSRRVLLVEKGALPISPIENDSPRQKGWFDLHLDPRKGYKIPFDRYLQGIRLFGLFDKGCDLKCLYLPYLRSIYFSGHPDPNTKAPGAQFAA